MRGTHLLGGMVRVRHCHPGAVSGRAAGTHGGAAHGRQEQRALRTRLACQLARMARHAEASQQPTQRARLCMQQERVGGRKKQRESKCLQSTLE